MVPRKVQLLFIRYAHVFDWKRLHQNLLYQSIQDYAPKEFQDPQITFMQKKKKSLNKIFQNLKPRDT